MFVHVIVLNSFWKPTELTQKLSLAAATASLVTQTVKNLPAMWEIEFDPWVGKIP